MGRSVFAQGFSIEQECCVHSAGMVGEKATGSWNTGQSLRNARSLKGNAIWNAQHVLSV